MKRFRTVCGTLSLLLIVATLCHGQESRATIVGRVLDPTGAVVPGAGIRAVNLATNSGGSSVANESGNFEIPYLLPGLYRATVRAAGFKSAIRDRIELRVADRLALDFGLEVGEVGYSVTVTGEAPLLETATASVGAMMNQRLLVDLPGVGGNPFYYTRLVSGVINAGAWGGGGRTLLGKARGIRSGLFGDWQVQGFFEGQTGAPLGFGDAIFNGNPHDIELPASERSVARWFNTGAGFNRDPRQQLGSNIRRLPSRFNGIRSDGINNFQLSAFKYFRVTERFRVRFMMMAVNALNHPQFLAPNTSPANSLFGAINNTAGGREVHWGLKVLF